MRSNDLSVDSFEILLSHITDGAVGESGKGFSLLLFIVDPAADPAAVYAIQRMVGHILIAALFRQIIDSCLNVEFV